MDKPETGKVCGLEIEILEQYLGVIKELYPLVDMATRFLELRARVSGIAIGVTNQRDALGHLVTLLLEDLTIEEKRAQIANTEEHLRRAVVESYQKAMTKKFDEFLTTLESYKKNVVPKSDHPSLATAPTWEALTREIDEIQKLREEARDKKRTGKANAKWREGIDAVVEAFDRLDQLHKSLEDYIMRVETMKSGKITQYSLWVGIGGVIIAVIGIMVGWVISQ